MSCNKIHCSHKVWDWRPTKEELNKESLFMNEQSQRMNAKTDTWIAPSVNIVVEENLRARYMNYLMKTKCLLQANSSTVSRQNLKAYSRACSKVSRLRSVASFLKTPGTTCFSSWTNMTSWLPWASSSIGFQRFAILSSWVWLEVECRKLERSVLVWACISLGMKPRRISDDITGDSSIMKTCCCCMDVRLGTIVLGFCHLVMSLFYLPFHFHVSVCSSDSVCDPLPHTVHRLFSYDNFFRSCEI